MYRDSTPTVSTNPSGPRPHLINDLCENLFSGPSREPEIHQFPPNTAYEMNQVSVPSNSKCALAKEQMRIAFADRLASVIETDEDIIEISDGSEDEVEDDPKPTDTDQLSYAEEDKGKVEKE